VASRNGELRVLRDGTWTVGGAPVVHGAALQYLKSRLLFEAGGAVIADGPRRVPVAIEGPAFAVLSLEVDAERGALQVGLDDGSQETLAPDALSLDEASGRVLCRVRGGCAEAVFGRGAHQTLLGHVEQDAERRFYLRAGVVRYPIRTA
jgi:hypothetical protein